MIEAIAFYFFSALSLALFWISVTSKNVLYSMTALAGGMISISGLFFLLNAEFVGVVQIMVYVGAVMVLYAFSMTIFDTFKELKECKRENIIVYSLSVVSMLLVNFIILLPIIKTKIKMPEPVLQSMNNTQIIGLNIFTKYLIAFELIAITLLVAMISVIIMVVSSRNEKVEL